MDESILFSLGFLSQNSLWKLSLNRGYKGIYIVGWEGMWKVIFYQTRCFGDLTSRLGWVASSSREQTAWLAQDFCPVVNSWRDASASSMLGTCASIWRLAAASHPRDPAASPCFFAQTWAVLHTLSHTSFTWFPPKYRVTNLLKYKQIWHGIKPTRWLIKFNLTDPNPTWLDSPILPCLYERGQFFFIFFKEKL